MLKPPKLQELRTFQDHRHNTWEPRVAKLFDGLGNIAALDGDLPPAAITFDVGFGHGRHGGGLYVEILLEGGEPVEVLLRECGWAVGSLPAPGGPSPSSSAAASETNIAGKTGQKKQGLDETMFSQFRVSLLKVEFRELEQRFLRCKHGTRNATKSYDRCRGSHLLRSRYVPGSL